MRDVASVLLRPSLAIVSAGASAAANHTQVIQGSFLPNGMRLGISAPHAIWRSHALMGSSEFPSLLASQAVCDGNRVRGAATKRKRGGIIAGVGAAVMLLSFFSTKATDTQFGPVVEQSVNLPVFLVGLATGGYGASQWFGRRSDATAWEDAVGSLTIGVSTDRDAVQCLGKPVSLSTSAVDETSILTYHSRAAGVVRSQRLHFKKGVLANIESVGGVQD